MKLVIGGRSQGKLNYVLQSNKSKKFIVCDCALPNNCEVVDKTIILNHFHGWIEERIRQEGCPEKEITAFINKYPECIIISDEIGNGIVPIDDFEREYRDRTGRILVELASRADEVIRVICGIGQKIK